MSNIQPYMTSISDVSNLEDSMRNNPDLWVEFMLDQEDTIKELNGMLNESTSRLELLLRDPDDHDH